LQIGHVLLALPFKPPQVPAHAHSRQTKCPFSQTFPPCKSFSFPQQSHILLGILLTSLYFHLFRLTFDFEIICKIEKSGIYFVIYLLIYCVDIICQIEERNKKNQLENKSFCLIAINLEFRQCFYCFYRLQTNCCYLAN
jgi:hypothetical protein